MNFPRKPRWLTRRRFLQIGLTGLTTSAITGLYTWQWEPHWVELVKRPLPIARLPESWIGKTLIQVSDLHIGRDVSDDYLLNAFARIKDLTPDLIVYTGDFATYGRETFAHITRLFPHLPLGRSGSFGILGNHDYGIKYSQGRVADRIANLAGQSGLRILRNEVAEVDGLQIAGLDDLWSGRFHPQRAWKHYHQDRAGLVLSHNPDTVDLPYWDNYQGWILAGHTHGGQCKPPFLPPPLLPVKNRRYVAGEYELTGGRRLYINRGLGHLLQVRFNVRPEITLFRLERA